MTFDEAMMFQAAFCDTNGAPITARVCRAIGTALDTGSATGRRAIAWPGDPIADALPLRLVAPFHALFRSGRAPVLAPLFMGTGIDATGTIQAAVSDHDEWIARWLDSPPQTNAVGRSALFMGALLTLTARFAWPVELIEIGSSAGLNLLIERYRYDLGDVSVGPAASPLTIAPTWRGAQPPHVEPRIASVAGCDVAPLDGHDAVQAERLLSYVWVDQQDRLTQTAAAIAMLREDPPDLVAADAADFVDARFAAPQPRGTTRVLMHSIVWQYLPAATQARIRAAAERAGAHATQERPVAWIAFEVERDVGRPVLTLRCWPGDAPPVELATAHPHGTWIDWTG